MKISLRAKISVIIIAMIGLGTGLMTYLVYTSSTHALKSSISDRLSITATQTMDKIDRFLYERTVNMDELAGRQQLQSFLAEPAAYRSAETAKLLTQQFEDFKNLSGTWNDFAVVDSQGNLPLQSSDLQNLRASLANQPSVRKLYASATAGQAGYSDAMSVGADHEPVMLFMTPIRNQAVVGQPIVGVLVGELAWQANLDILNSLHSTQATLINRNGLSLGDNQPEAEDEILSLNFRGSKVFTDAEKRITGSGIYPGLDNTKDVFLTSFVREAGYLNYQGNQWTLVLETPVATAFAPAKQLTKNLIYTDLSILVLSVIVFIIIMEVQVVQPLTLLKTAAGKLSAGNFSEPVRIASHDEIGQLGAAFNTMAQNLQEAHEGLRQRTKEAESEERLTNTLLQSLPVGVTVVEAPSGKMIMMNDAGEKISGRGMSKQPAGSHHAQTYNVVREDKTPYPKEELPLTIALKEQKIALKDDIIIQHPDGTLVAVRAIATPIKGPSGQIERAVSVFEDITAERELERSREEFFSIASHELRTPLTAIRGNSEMIQKMYGDKITDPDMREMIADINESALRLIDIVNDFLDTSRLEQKHMKFELEPVDLVANAESVIKEYQVTGSRQKIHLEVVQPEKPLPKVIADNNRVKQIFINLVGNALKFTDNGSVTISFEGQPGFVKAIVTDTGRGMTPEAQKLLFKKFEQTGSTVLTRDSVRGTGLGLYISKMIAEQLQGHIQLESSAVGVGTSFSFSLPLASDSSASASTKPTAK